MRADRWQTGDCGIYAMALIEARPGLRFGAVFGRHGSALHFFAHDDTHAYDSTGASPLPYVRVWDSACRDYFPADAAGSMGFRCVLDLNPADFGDISEAEREALPAARRHIRRHNVLQPA